MTSRRFFHTLCALLLLLAQQGALFHATWHASGTQADHLAHGYDGHAHDHHVNPESSAGKSRENGQGSLCAFDLAFGQVLGGTHGACAPLAFVPAVVERIYDLTAPRLHAEAVSPRSRGPPVLL